MNLPATNSQVAADRQAEDSFEGGSRFNEMEEMELAAELLEVTDEAELDQFLGKLLKKAGRAVGRSAEKPAGRNARGLSRRAPSRKRCRRWAARLEIFWCPEWAAPSVADWLPTRDISSAWNWKVSVRKIGSLRSPASSCVSEARRRGRPLGWPLTLARSGAGTLARWRKLPQDALLAAAQKYAPGFIRAGANLMHGDCGCGGTSTCNCGSHNRRHHTNHTSGSWVRHGREIHLLGV